MARYVRADPDTTRKWIIEFGLPSLVVAIGFAMTGYMNFWLGIAIMTFATAVLVIDFWVRNAQKKRTYKFGGSLALVAAFAVLLWFVFVPAPLDVLINAPPKAYPSGIHVLGLEWKDGEFPINVSAANDTSVPFENLDSYFRVDSTLISRVGVYGGINTCVASPENKNFRFTQGSISTSDLSIPLLEPGQQISASIYRVRCDKIAPHSHIDLVIAAATALAGCGKSRHRGDLKFGWASDWKAISRLMGPIARVRRSLARAGAHVALSSLGIRTRS